MRMSEVEGEHAVEALRRVRSPSVPGFEDDLGVAVGEKAVAKCLQLRPQLEVVLCAAIEDEREPARHHTFSVRPPRDHRTRHRTDSLHLRRRAVEGDLAA